jgi:hypothetical protein
MRRGTILGGLSVAILSLSLGTLRADPPASRSAPAPEGGLVLRCQAKPSAEEQVFDGEFIALTPPPLVGNGPFSISVWVQASDLDSGNTGYGRGIARSTRGEHVGDWLLSVHPDGRVRFCNWRKTGDDTAGSHLTRNPVIVPETWCHLVATWDGKMNQLFVNGVEVPYDNGATAAGWGTGHEVGRCWTQPDYYWSGRIDDLRIYRRSLTEAEIQQAFKATPHVQARTVIQPAGDPKVSAALDREIFAKLQQHRVVPAPVADDAEFHRRVLLDLAGRIPTVAKTEAFQTDPSPGKRERLIDTLLAGREMPMTWSLILSGWLMPRESRRDPQFVAYLRNGLAKNKSWDRFGREMLVARPRGRADQAASYFLTYRLPALKDQTIARDVGRAFFGVNLRCAQCHDHPHVHEWTRERFFGLSAFFVRSYESPYTDAQNQKIVALAEKAAGELEYAGSDGSKKIAALRFLDGKVVGEPPTDKNAKEAPPPHNAPPPAPAFSRREALARVALDSKSPYLKRALVNRVWLRLMGRALVEPVDMMYDGNPATHPQLLDLLANDCAAHGFDLRRLIAVIMKSQAYARSSHWPGQGDLPNETLYAVAVLKPLDADQLALALPLATGYYEGQLGSGSTRNMAQLRSVAAWKEIIAEFDAHGDEFEPTAAQALFLLNSNYVQTHLLAKGNLAQALSALSEDAALARRAYLSILGRPPSPEETALVSRYLRERGAKVRAEACRELVWALISSAEFRFNH